MDARALAATGSPVLLIDTCSILDVMRDPTRDTMRVHERQAGLDLLVAAESGRLTVIIAHQVAIEFAEHDQTIQDEAGRALARLRGQVTRVNELSALLGAPGAINLDHLDDHVARVRDLVARWLVQGVGYRPDAAVFEKAITRVNGNIAPARRGKESTKDCVVFETYLEAATRLRAEGLGAPIVFLSSNSQEYLTDGSVLKAEIAADFATSAVAFASNMAWAKSQLGL